MTEYGVVIGRFQPVHIGHQAIVNEILLDGRIPVVVLGSSQEDRDREKNPLSFEQRVDLWRTIYPNTEMFFIKSVDHKLNEDWYTSIMDELTLLLGKGACHVLYYYNKEEDRATFMYRNSQYHNMFFTQIFEDEGWETKQVQFAGRSDIKIEANARDIRRDLEAFKHLLDGRVYTKLKRRY